MGAEFGVHLYLVDHLDMTPDLDTLDIFDLPKIHQQQLGGGNESRCRLQRALDAEG